MNIWLELFGYLGSVLVLASMFMSSMFWLRTINMVGGFISGIYAILIRSYPIAIMNFSIIAINLYKVHKLKQAEKAAAAQPKE